MSHSRLEYWSPSRRGERTPLRSLENEMLHSPTPLRFGSKPQLSGDMTQLCSSQFNKAAMNVPHTTDTAQTVDGLGDVTFKTFICSGGEIDISGSSESGGESLIFLKDATTFPANVEDPVASPSRMEQSCDEHMEHPYSSLNVKQPDIPSDADVVKSFYWKSFACDGGEVEVSDSTGLQEETVPLPRHDLWDPPQDDGTSSADCTQLFPGEHVDHLYCFSENDPITASKGSENTTDGLADQTLKSFNCSGGEVEISKAADPADDTIHLSHTNSDSNSCNYSADLSVLENDNGLENGIDHLDHPYCDIKYSPLSDHLDDSQDPHGVEETREINTTAPSEQEDNIGLSSISVGNAGKSDDDDQSVSDPTLTPLKENLIQHTDQTSCHLGEAEVVSDAQRPPPTEAPLTDTESGAMDDEAGNADHVPSDCSHIPASAGPPLQEAVQQQPDHVTLSEAKDSALGSLGPVLCDSGDKVPEASPEIFRVLSECPSIASALQFLSPIVRRASVSLLKLPAESHQDEFLAEDSALEGEKSLVTPVDFDPAALLAEHLRSPMPRPLFNSTVVGAKPQPGSAAEPEDSGRKPHSEAAPLVPEGQLQQQFRQVAEFLIMACGRMGSAPAPPLASDRAAAVESHSVGVGTSPVKTTEHSLNTSGILVNKREFSVTDSCTVTEPLIWNLPPGNLESLPRQELVQRLMSSMIMVEALVQQLAASRAHRQLSSGPPPSDLREKLVQTDHTELSQTSMYRDLYLEALSRIEQLELDGSSLHNLVQAMQGMRATMSSLSSDTAAALSKMKQAGETIREDHHSLASHYEHMKALLEKSKDTQRRMLDKMKEVLHQRNEMRAEMEEGLKAKEAAFDAMDQLRTHCASEISALEKCVGCQRELLAALNRTYPEQVALNKASHETLNSACDLLSQTVEEHSRLMDELRAARSLLQKTTPTLVQLKETAAAALRQRDEHRSAGERAVEQREQTEEELREAQANLQAATHQISDLNLQITILTSEMGVLRQKLTDKEEETGLLERKVTALSATISSTLASHAFLEQTLAAETTRFQESRKDLHQANDRANRLEASLEESEQRVCELNRVLAETEEQLCQLQNLSQSQSAEIQRLQHVCAQLSGVQEMNEFLQMENEVAREQVVESERTLRSNLQALRERNFECEDLKGELRKLQVENKTLCEELEAARSAATVARGELQEKTAHVVAEISALHGTLRGLIQEQHASLSDQREEQLKEPTPFISAERHPSSSFVDSVMVALTAEKDKDVRPDSPSVPSDPPEPQSEGWFSETSAFTRVAALTPKKNSGEAQDEEEEEEQSSLAELLSGLGAAAVELTSTLTLVRQSRDANLQELHNTIGGLQVEQQSAETRHQAEVLELNLELRRLSSLVERGNQALQHKAQDEKTLTKLMADVQEAQEILSKHKSDNNELRKEAMELRRSLQESRVESQVLREELRNAGGATAVPARRMEEKIQLLKEVEKLKAGLHEAEQAKVRLLERAKRHQMIHQTNQEKSEKELQILNHMINKVRVTLLSLPEVVKACEPLQQLVEYIG